MKKNNSLSGRFGLKGLVLAVLTASLGITSCKTDFDLDKRTPEWLGTSIFETLQQGFEGNDGKYYHFNNFVNLIRDMGLEPVLAKTGSKTLFVADDEAFERFFANCPFEGVTCYEDLSHAQKTMILNGSMLNNVYQVAMLSSTPNPAGSGSPVIGNCMRRISAASVYDTIPILMPEDMPSNNAIWSEYKTKFPNGMVVMNDGTRRSMIFFVDKFLTSHKITDDDYDFLFNQGARHGKPGRTPGDATVNGVKIEYKDKKCFNGFLHVMSDVVYLLPSMAEYLERDTEKASIYSHILDRFSCPVYTKSVQDEVLSRIEIPATSENVQKVFSRQYFSSRSKDGKEFLIVPNTNRNFTDKALLKFDPGWNEFYAESGSTESDIALQQDMAAMFVPTDATLMDWWLNKPSGQALRKRYGLARFDPERGGHLPDCPDSVAADMDSIPEKVIVKLINNNMQSSLTNTVPSKFPSVLNDAQDPLFDGVADPVSAFDSIVMCCNGAIYYTNSVFTPTAYRSVSYPALVNEYLQIINAAIEDDQLQFSAYLNSMQVTYSFFVPTAKSEDPNVNGKLVWLDPTSIAVRKNNPDDIDYLQAMVFRYNAVDSEVEAEVYKYDEATGTITELMSSSVSASVIQNRLRDLMDYHIIIGEVENSSVTDENGYAYFPTKGRGTIRFKMGGAADELDKMEVAGGYQLENPNAKITILERHDQKADNGNGVTYVIDRPLLTSAKSVYDVLSDSVNYPEFKEFFKLMNGAVSADGKTLFVTSSNKNDIASAYNVSTFNTYHYTIYVPENEKIRKLINDGVIMTPNRITEIDSVGQAMFANLDEQNPETSDAIFSESIQKKYPEIVIVKSTNPDSTGLKQFNAFIGRKRSELQNFVRYHIQDNAVIANAKFDAGYNDDGSAATIANYETAYMKTVGKNQQFVKLTVEGGKDITVKDVKGHTRKVLRQSSAESGKPLFNILCREYEFKVGTNTGLINDVSTAMIETSSYAVIHLIDDALCNGEVDF